jgi:hypothetical protein
MINTTAEHDQSDSLPALQPLVLMQMAHDPARQITRYLDERMFPATLISNSNQISLVVLAGNVVEGRSELAFGVH